MNKKGQFGFDTLMSYLVFIVFLLLTLLGLGITGCTRGDVGAGIKTVEGTTLGDLRLSQQLSSYLRTDMLDFDTLKDKINQVADVVWSAEGFIGLSFTENPRMIKGWLF